MKNFEYTIIIPVYNAEKFMQRCLESIVSQTYKDFEVLVIDDGSTDQTLEICRKFAESDDRIQVFHQENAGVSSARNRGIEAGKGENIVFVDADDCVEPFFLEFAARYQEFDWVIFPDTTLNPEMVTGRKDIKEIQKCLLFPSNKKYEKFSLASPWSKVYKRRIIQENNIRFCSEVRIGEDLLFNLRYSLEIATGILMNRQIYFYEENEDSAMRKFNPHLVRDDSLFQKHLEEILCEFGLEDLRGEQAYSIFNGTYKCLAGYFGDDRNKNTVEKNARELRQYLGEIGYQSVFQSYFGGYKSNFNQKEKVFLRLCSRPSALWLCCLLLKCMGKIKHIIRRPKG